MNFTDREIVSLFFNVARLSRNIPGTKGNDLLPFIGQYRCLLLLENSGPINQKGLADALQIRPASLSELLDKMQKSGWIQRRVNEKDRRKINIFLTEDGKGISQQMIEARRDMASTVFGVLNEEEQEQLEMLLSKLISELEKNQGEEFSD